MKKIQITIDNLRYNGELLVVGTPIDVVDPTADRLIAEGKATLVDSKATTKPTTDKGATA